jgi:hypothetical protein
MEFRVKTVKELLIVANSLYKLYGDAPLEYEIIGGEMPSDCHIGFEKAENEHVIEIFTDKNTTYTNW